MSDSDVIQASGAIEPPLVGNNGKFEFLDVGFSLILIRIFRIHKFQINNNNNNNNNHKHGQRLKI